MWLWCQRLAPQSSKLMGRVRIPLATPILYKGEDEMIKVKIDEYQFNELNQGILFINKYDIDFKYLYEMNRYWKEFCFDLLNELQLKNLMMAKEEYLLSFLKNNYKIIIEENNLNIDFKDYIELNDYVLLEDWLKEDNNSIEQNENGIFLLQE